MQRFLHPFGSLYLAGEADFSKLPEIDINAFSVASDMDALVDGESFKGGGGIFGIGGKFVKLPGDL